MDLKQIRYFIAVADAGSFSAGARRAFVTQPTLSGAIAALEKELGHRLFERRARGVTLTIEGSRCLAHARSVLREAESMKAAGMEAAPAKPMRIGLLPTLPPKLVTDLLGLLQRVRPGQHVAVDDAPSAALAQRLANGRYDAILTTLDKPKPGRRQVRIGRDALALAVPRQMRWPRNVTPRILHGHPLIVRVHCEQLQASSRILDNWGVRPQVIARTDSDARALAMVAAGLGACLMPDSLRHPDVAFLRPEGVSLPRQLGLEWVKGPAASWFDTLEASLRKTFPV